MIDLPSCTGSVIDHGATVKEWAPRGSAPVLFTSAAAVLTEDTALRGGIPICFPWFGPGREPGAPRSHGFARTAPWTLVGNDIVDDEQIVTYRLSRDGAIDEHWPHDYWAVLTVRFGSSLTVSLSVTNLDTAAFSFEAALHTYLAIGSIHDVRIDGLDGVSFVDKTAGGAVRQQTGPLTFAAETDNVYATPGPVTLVDPTGGREITIESSGASHVIVWNPWQEKAAQIADLAPGEWERFVCVEAGRVLDGAVHLEPGQTHTLSTTLRLPTTTGEQSDLP